VDLARRDALEAERLERAGAMEALKADALAIEGELQELAAQQRALTDRSRARQQALASIKTKEASLKRLKARLADAERTASTESTRRQLEKDMGKCAEKALKAGMALATVAEQMAPLQIDKIGLGLDAKEAAAELARGERSLEALHQRLVALDRALEAAKADRNAAKATVLRLMGEAEMNLLASPLAEEDGGNRDKWTTEGVKGGLQPSEELKAVFGSLPDEVDELEGLAEAKREELEATLCANPHVAKVYEQRRQQLKEISGEVERLSADKAKQRDTIDRVVGQWLPNLRELVGTINASFAGHFAELGCAGEVGLVEAGEDYGAYGIEIRVRFRADEQLQVLSGQRQSGGEKSVSTIIYLTALQSLTKCPFRVVDEINQGMDPTNERRIFQQLVHTCSKPGQPQCFLLTPKLLPDLDYSDKCHLLFIFNGPWCGQAKAMLEDTLQALRGAEAGAGDEEGDVLAGAPRAKRIRAL